MSLFHDINWATVKTLVVAAVLIAAISAGLKAAGLGGFAKHMG